MRWYEPAKHAFEVIDRELANRMIAHVGGRDGAGQTRTHCNQIHCPRTP